MPHNVPILLCWHRAGALLSRGVRLTCPLNPPFDPMTIRDRSTYAEPHLLSEGVRYVLVNGIPVLWNGTMTGKTPGQFVRRQRDSHK